MDTLTRLRQGSVADLVILSTILYGYSYEEYIQSWRVCRSIFDMEEPVVREVYNGFYNELNQDNKWK